MWPSTRACAPSICRDTSFDFQRGVLVDAELAHEALHAFAAEDAHQVILEGQEESRLARIPLATRPAAELIVDAPRFVTLGADDVETADIGDTFAEHDVGAAPRHVRCDRDAAALPGIGDDIRLFLVQLGVEHGVLNAELVQHPAQALTFLDACGSNQDGLPLPMPLGDLVDHGAVFAVLALVDQVGLVEPHHRPVGRNRHHLEGVDLAELLRLGDRRTGHARELVVEAEEVLEGNRCEGDRLLLHGHAFLGLDRLVEPVRPAASRHGSPGELVDDDHLAVAHDVILVAEPQRVRTQRLVDLVRLRGVLHLIDVGDARPFLDLVDALLGQRGRLGLLVDRVVVFGDEPRYRSREV